MEIARGTSRGLGFRNLMLENERIIASDMFRAEVRYAFWRYVRAKFLPAGQAEVLIEKAIELVDEFVPLEDNAAESFAEAVRQNHPVHDFFTPRSRGVMRRRCSLRIESLLRSASAGVSVARMKLSFSSSRFNRYHYNRSIREQKALRADKRGWATA